MIPELGHFALALACALALARVSRCHVGSSNRAFRSGASAVRTNGVCAQAGASA